MTYQDTIAALATAQGNGAIAIIRLSGKDAISIADRHFRSVKDHKSLTDQKRIPFIWVILLMETEFLMRF